MSHVLDVLLKLLPGDVWTYAVMMIVWAIGRYVKLEWFKTLLEPSAKIVGLFISKTVLLIPKITAKTAENIEVGFFSTLFQLLSWYFGRIDYWMRSDNIVKSIVTKTFDTKEDKKPKYSKPENYFKR